MAQAAARLPDGAGFSLWRSLACATSGAVGARRAASPRVLRLQDSGKAYFTGALGVLASRVVTICAGILSLWLLTRILSTEDFAGYSVAMSVVVVAGYSVGLGIERSMLLRIGELEIDAGRLAGAGMMRRILLLVAALSGAAALAAAFWAGAGETPRHDFVRLLAPVIPATALALVLVTWYQANHRVGVSQAMQGLTDGTRSLVFVLTMALGLGAAGVAAGAVIGAAAPLIFLGLRASGRSRTEPVALQASDLGAGLQFLLMRLARMGLHQFDVIALGVLGSAVGTAQYVVAARFAMLIESGQTVFAPTFAPRVRRHLATGRSDLAEREYHVSRIAGFSLALAASVLFVLAGRPILEQFGAFGVDYEAFMILVAANLLTVGVGMHSTFLSMTDQLGRSTANRVVGLIVFGVCLWMLVPRYDAMGAAVSFLIATLLHEVTGVVILKRHLGIRALSRVEAVTLAVACAALCAVGFGYAAPLHGALVLVAVLVLGIGRERELIGAILRELRRIVLRQG